MIFDWKRKFSQDLLESGQKLNAIESNRKMNSLEGIVIDEDRQFKVHININDSRIGEMHCECAKKKCLHMTALLFANENVFNKSHIDPNSNAPDNRLYLILRDYDFDKSLENFIKTDLTGLYKSGDYAQVFYLITVMFEKLIDKHTYDEESCLEESYERTVCIIKKLYEHIPGSVNEFIEHCIKNDYLKRYPPFNNLYGFYIKHCDSFKKGYEIKVRLADFRPITWRDLIVPENITFKQLDTILKTTLDFKSIQSSAFEIYQEKTLILDKSLNTVLDAEYDINSTRLAKIFDRYKKIFYLYGMDNDWKFEIAIKGKVDYVKDYPTLQRFRGEYNPLEECRGAEQFAKVVDCALNGGEKCEECELVKKLKKINIVETQQLLKNQCNLIDPFELIY